MFRQLIKFTRSPLRYRLVELFLKAKRCFCSVRRFVLKMIWTESHLGGHCRSFCMSMSRGHSSGSWIPPEVEQKVRNVPFVFHFLSSNLRFVMIALAYAVPTGVIAGWSGVLDMILTPAKVNQVGETLTHMHKHTPFTNHQKFDIFRIISHSGV